MVSMLAVHVVVVLVIPDYRIKKSLLEYSTPSEAMQRAEVRY